MDAEKNFIDAWNAGKVHRVSDGAKPWVGLTDDETMQVWDGVIKYAPSEMRVKDFAKAIEARLKEKNNG